MDTLLHALDRHFQLPAIHRVNPSQARIWLRQGWEDLRANPVPSLTWGALYAIIGYLVLAWAAPLPYLIVAAVSGFLLIGPIAAAGVYELSRQRDEGEQVGFIGSIHGLRGHGEQLALYGAFLMFALIAWERLSAILFALFDQGSGTLDVTHMAQEIFLSPAHLDFVTAYIVIGGVLAMLVFALSAVSVPMMLDRKVDLITAMMTSLRAVTANPGAMLAWAAIIAALVTIGFATWMIGMVVLLPLLGHASWHAYRDLVEL